MSGTAGRDRNRDVSTTMRIEECQDPWAALIQKLTEDNKRLRTELAVALARVERAEAALTSIADWSNAPVTVARKALGIYT